MIKLHYCNVLCTSKPASHGRREPMSLLLPVKYRPELKFTCLQIHIVCQKHTAYVCIDPEIN